MKNLPVIAALGLLIGSGVAAQQFQQSTTELDPTMSGTLNISTGTGVSSITWGGNVADRYAGHQLTYIPPTPDGAVYHQVVDVFYNAEGREIKTESTTHAITPYCHPGLRKQDLIAQDDGHGHVQFYMAQPAEVARLSEENME